MISESQATYSLMKGEVSAKTTYQRTSKGPLSIPEVNPEGKFVVIENSISNRKVCNKIVHKHLIL